MMVLVLEDLEDVVASAADRRDDTLTEDEIRGCDCGFQRSESQTVDAWWW
jgi:hypothetical protein